MISATYFDGSSGKQHQVLLGIMTGQIHVMGQDVSRTEAIATVRLGEPFAAAPCVLEFTDGARCEVGLPHKQELLSALQFRKSLVQRCQDKWPGALGALVLLLALLMAAYQWGIPAVAEHVAGYIPIEMEKKLGDEAWASLDKQFLEPSKLDESRQLDIQILFDKLRPPQPRMPLRLEFRSSKNLGANALALPNGTIIMTDRMVELIEPSNVDLNDYQKTMLAGVLAHEIAHVEARHSLRMLAATSLSGVLSWALIGDFSGVVAAAPALMTRLQFSRAMENEADAYAIKMLTTQDMGTEGMADLFARLDHDSREDQRELPAWMRATSSYLSTHPSTEQRIARLRAGGR